MKRKKPGSSAETSGATHLAAMESAILSKHHSLVAHCAVTRYDDGEPRKPGWVTLKTMGSSWIVQVKDPDACVSMQVISTTLDDALTMADLLLSAEDAPWEPDPFLKRAGGPTRK